MSTAISISRFSEIALKNIDLHLFLLSCPGMRVGEDGMIAKLEYLDEDLQRLKSFNMRMVLSCLCDVELALGVDAYANEYERLGIEWRRVPIPDMSPPGPEHDASLDRVFAEARDIVAEGGGFAIHCLAGLGRTGTVAARFAMEKGLSAAEAIAFIRSQHDGKAIETAGQENYLIERNRIV